MLVRSGDWSLARRVDSVVEEAAAAIDEEEAQKADWLCVRERRRSWGCGWGWGLGGKGKEE